MWNQETREATTRSAQRDLGVSASARGMGNDGAQVGYGEITKGGGNNLLTLFDALTPGNHAVPPFWVLSRVMQLRSCGLTESSRFLDVGSGLGKLVLHMSLARRCISWGIEILSSRV